MKNEKAFHQKVDAYIETKKYLIYGSTNIYISWPIKTPKLRFCCMGVNIIDVRVNGISADFIVHRTPVIYKNHNMILSNTPKQIEKILTRYPRKIMKQSSKSSNLELLVPLPSSLDYLKPPTAHNKIRNNIANVTIMYYIESSAKNKHDGTVRFDSNDLCFSNAATENNASYTFPTVDLVMSFETRCSVPDNNLVVTSGRFIVLEENKPHLAPTASIIDVMASTIRSFTSQICFPIHSRNIIIASGQLRLKSKPNISVGNTYSSMIRSFTRFKLKCRLEFATKMLARIWENVQKYLFPKNLKTKSTLPVAILESKLPIDTVNIVYLPVELLIIDQQNSPGLFVAAETHLLEITQSNYAIIFDKMFIDAMCSQIIGLILTENTKNKWLISGLSCYLANKVMRRLYSFETLQYFQFLDTSSIINLSSPSLLRTNGKIRKWMDSQWPSTSVFNKKSINEATNLIHILSRIIGEKKFRSMLSSIIQATHNNSRSAKNRENDQTQFENTEHNNKDFEVTAKKKSNAMITEDKISNLTNKTLNERTCIEWLDVNYVHKSLSKIKSNKSCSFDPSYLTTLNFAIKWENGLQKAHLCLYLNKQKNVDNMFYHDIENFGFTKVALYNSENIQTKYYKIFSSYQGSSKIVFKPKLLENIKKKTENNEKTCLKYRNKIKTSPFWLFVDPTGDWLRDVRVLQKDTMWVTQLQSSNDACQQLRAIYSVRDLILNPPKISDQAFRFVKIQELYTSLINIVIDKSASIFIRAKATVVLGQISSPILITCHSKTNFSSNISTVCNNGQHFLTSYIKERRLDLRIITNTSNTSTRLTTTLKLDSFLLLALAYVRNKFSSSPTDAINIFLALATDLQISNKNRLSDFTIFLSLIESFGISKIVSNYYRYKALVIIKKIVEGCSIVEIKQGLIIAACLKTMVMLSLNNKADIIIMISYLRTYLSSPQKSIIKARQAANECIIGILCISNENLDVVISYILNILLGNLECELIKHSSMLYLNTMLKRLIIIRNKSGIRFSRKILISLHKMDPTLKSPRARDPNIEFIVDPHVESHHYVNRNLCLSKSHESKKVFPQNSTSIMNRFSFEDIVLGEKNRLVKKWNIWSWFHFKKEENYTVFSPYSTHEKKCWSTKQRIVKKWHGNHDLCESRFITKALSQNKSIEFSNIQANQISLAEKQTEKNIFYYKKLSDLPSQLESWFTSTYGLLISDQ